MRVDRERYFDRVPFPVYIVFVFHTVDYLNIVIVD